MNRDAQRLHTPADSIHFDLRPAEMIISILEQKKLQSKDFGNISIYLIRCETETNTRREM